MHQQDQNPYEINARCQACDAETKLTIPRNMRIGSWSCGSCGQEHKGHRKVVKPSAPPAEPVTGSKEGPRDEVSSDKLPRGAGVLYG